MKLHRTNGRTTQVPYESLHYAARFELIRAQYFRERGDLKQALLSHKQAEKYTLRIEEEANQ